MSVLKDLRENKNMTQKQFAEKMEVSLERFQELEEGSGDMTVTEYCCLIDSLDTNSINVDKIARDYAEEARKKLETI